MYFKCESASIYFTDDYIVQIPNHKHLQTPKKISCSGFQGNLSAEQLEGKEQPKKVI